MKALTVKQPWASLIVTGVKDIENRTWKTNFRGRLLIHAGKHIPFKEIDLLVRQRGISCWQEGTYPEGAIIGSVEIVGCVINHSSIWAEKSNDYSPAYPNGVPAIYGNKKYPPIYNWVLANPIMFEKPIPAKGKLSFWEFDQGSEFDNMENL